MVIISSYRIVPKTGEKRTFYVRGSEESRCPCCGGTLHVIGSRPRIVRQSDGQIDTLIIRRLRCCTCGKVHHELPDMIIPYKRHSSECIARVLIDSSYPCELSSALRLRHWFILLKRAVLNLLESSLDILRFHELTASSGSGSQETMETLLKFLVEKAVNTGKSLYRLFYG